MASQFTRFLELPDELKILILQQLPLGDLLPRVSRTSKKMQAIIDHPAFLKGMFFKLKSSVKIHQVQDLVMALYVDYDQLKLEIKNTHPFKPDIENLPDDLDRIDKCGECTRNTLTDIYKSTTHTQAAAKDKWRQAVVNHQNTFYSRMRSSLKGQEAVTVFHVPDAVSVLGESGVSELKETIEALKNELSQSNSSCDTNFLLYCFSSIQMVLDKCKGGYLYGRTRGGLEYDNYFHYYRKVFHAIVLNPAWHQLVLSAEGVRWYQLVAYYTNKYPLFMLPVLSHPAFRKSIADNPEHIGYLLDIVKLKEETRNSLIPAKIYQYCLKHYNFDFEESTIPKLVFEHYDAQYPRVFQDLITKDPATYVAPHQSISALSCGYS